jgi:hypothetical protein
MLLEVGRARPVPETVVAEHGESIGDLAPKAVVDHEPA